MIIDDEKLYYNNKETYYGTYNCFNVLLGSLGCEIYSWASIEFQLLQYFGYLSWLSFHVTTHKCKQHTKKRL